MHAEIKANLVVTSLITSAVILIILSEDNMSFTESLLIALIPSALTALITYKVSKKSKYEKLNETIKDTENSIINLKDNYNNQSERILADIGRGENHASLSTQHDDIKMLMQQRFSNIEKRYDKEDERLRALSEEQLDIRNSMSYFLRSYEELAKSNDYLDRKYHILSEDYALMRDEVANLKAQNEQLNNIIERQRSRLDAIDNTKAEEQSVDRSAKGLHR